MRVDESVGCGTLRDGFPYIGVHARTRAIRLNAEECPSVSHEGSVREKDGRAVIRPTLRKHQAASISELRQGVLAGHIRQILYGPTGFGKTVCAVELACLASIKGHVVYFVTERTELVVQAVDAMRSAGLTVSIVQGENTCIEPGHNVVVGTIQSLSRRDVPPPGLLIIDEVHVLHRAHIDLLERWAHVPTIGLTATPFTRGLGQYFTNMVQAATVSELMALDLLAPITAYGPSTPDLAGVQTRGGDFVASQLSECMRRQIHAPIVETWQQLGESRPTLVFACDIAHARSIAESFVAAGIDAEAVDGYQDTADRRETIDRFKRGEIKVLVSVACLSVGFDAPIASCAILARPTKSLTLHLQQLGRVLRTHPGKDDALVLDHAGNIERHGLPEDIGIGDLDTQTKTWTARTPTERLPKPCPACKRMKPVRVHACPACGFAPERQATVATVEGKLEPIRGKAAAEHRRKTYQEFVGLARAWQKKPGWAFYLYQLRFGKAPGSTWRNLPPLQPSPETIRFVQAERIRYAKLQGSAA